MKNFSRLPKELKRKVCKVCEQAYFKPRDWSNALWIASKYCSLKCCHIDPDYQNKRAKSISETQKGRKLSDTWKKSISEARKGMKFSKSHCENIGKTHRGLMPWNKGGKGLQVAWNKGLKGYRVGELNNNWKGGITPINKAIRESFEYEEWRTKVFERDLYTCQGCGDIGGYLEADHIKPFSLFPDLRFDVDNGRTFCKPCHKKYGWSLFRENNPKKEANFVIGQNI